ncbi:hypothetical protein VP1G_09047 [Cytospora mali]|uniref:Uncharacterized protein n=1 Tax=Cytospora mali TaxID=578113 RepID=A0A194VDB8_CYTMA|nr:hypothetical protein VP1G_09047 [Valsa mali var. pyri (nom. inval.)]
MCHQITYTLPCEHTRTDIVYCADAPLVEPSSKGSSSKPSKSSSKKDHGKKHRESSKDKDKRSNSPPKRRPCRNLTSQSIAYPLPPSFQGNPSTAASSPLLPKCTLPRCPFEQRNRCWNCCWCGKGWNEQGRCSCIMIIEGNEVRCEHICCETCTPAGLM